MVLKQDILEALEKSGIAKERSPMEKRYLGRILFAAAACSLLVGLLWSLKSETIAQTEITKQEQSLFTGETFFVQEPFTTVSADEVEAFLASDGTGIVYFGAADHAICQQMAPEIAECAQRFETYNEVMYCPMAEGVETEAVLNVNRYLLQYETGFVSVGGAEESVRQALERVEADETASPESILVFYNKGKILALIAGSFAEDTVQPLNEAERQAFQDYYATYHRLLGTDTCEHC